MSKRLKLKQKDPRVDVPIPVLLEMFKQQRDDLIETREMVNKLIKRIEKLESDNKTLSDLRVQEARKRWSPFMADK